MGVEWLTPEVVIGLIGASGAGAFAVKAYEIKAARKDGKHEKELSLIKQLKREYEECQRELMKCRNEYYDQYGELRAHKRKLRELEALDDDGDTDCVDPVPEGDSPEDGGC